MRLFSITLVAALAAQAGCAGFLQPSYAKLPPQQIQSLQLGLANGGAQFCAAGPEVQLRAGVHMTDGTSNATWAYGTDGTAAKDGRLDFADFTWHASLGAITSDGRYVPPADPIIGLDRPVTIDAAVKGRPELHQSIQLAPSYACRAVVEHDGARGGNGAAGSDGLAGSDGTLGGNGSDGARGDDGGDGGVGQDGPRIDVSLGYVSGATGPLVLAKVETGDAIDYTILDPSGPALAIVAHGGAGGDGGAGGAGGRGGAGGTSSDGTTTGSSGSDGQSGWAGGGGNGGRGGTVRVFFDARHPELQAMVRVDATGGAGGGGQGNGARGADGPAPSFAPRSADALFPGELAHGVPVVR